MRRHAMAKPREFWVLLQGGSAQSVNWAGYDAQSVYIGEDLEPRVGDVIVKVREFEFVKLTKKNIKDFQEPPTLARGKTEL
jgi:hypothetical protein